MKRWEYTMKIGKLLADSDIPNELGVKLSTMIDQAIQSAIDEARAAERERCARIAEKAPTMTFEFSRPITLEDLPEIIDAVLETRALRIRNGDAP